MQTIRIHNSYAQNFLLFMYHYKSGNTVRACIYFIIEMSDKVHYNGRFIKRKFLNKRLKAVGAMAEAKKHQKSVLN